MADFWAGYGQQQKTAPKQASGGLGGFLYDSFVKPTIDSTARGGQALTKIANNIGNKGFGHTFDNVNGKQLLADTVTTGTSFAPIGAAKGVMGAVRLGAGIGAANGAANTFAQGGNAGEIVSGGLGGALAGGATGGALGMAGRLLGALRGGRTPTASPDTVVPVGPTRIGFSGATHPVDVPFTAVHQVPTDNVTNLRTPAEIKAMNAVKPTIVSAPAVAARRDLVGKNYINLRNISEKPKPTYPIDTAPVDLRGDAPIPTRTVKTRIGSPSTTSRLLGQTSALTEKTPGTVGVPGQVRGGKVSTFLQDKGLQTQARSGGYGVGERSGPGRSLGYMDSAQVNEDLKAAGIKAGSPTARAKQVELTLGGLGKDIDGLINKSNQPLEVGNHAQVVGDYLHSVANQPGVDPAVARSAKQLAANFIGQVKDTKSLIAFRRNLDKQVINFGQNPDSAMAAKQLAARTFRDVLKDHTNQLVPGIQDLNNRYHALTNASEYLKDGSKVLSDQSQSSGGGIFGRLLTNETAQAAKSRTGAAMQSMGQALGTPTTSPRSGKISNLLARTAEAGAGVESTTASQGAPTEQPAMAPGQFSDTFAANTGMGGQSDTAAESSAYGQEAMLADIQRDPKHAADYMALYKALQPTAQTSSIGKPTASQFGAAQSGLSSIQMMEQILSKDPGVVGRTAIPGQNAPLISGLVRNAAGTGDYQAAAQNAIDAIARARTGAAMNKSEEDFYQRMLPTAGDSAQTVQYKIGQLKAALEPFMAQQGGGATGDGSYADNQQILQALGL
jgi:hypothetical protein